MKVTKKEIVEGFAALVGEDVGEIHLGTEFDGDMVVIAVVGAFRYEFSQALSIVAMKCAKAYGEKYKSYAMSSEWFEKYKAYNGFEEVAEEKPFPVKLEWYIAGALVSMVRDAIVSDEELEDFCLETAEKINARGRK